MLDAEVGPAVRYTTEETSMKLSQQLTLGIWRAMWNASHFLDLYLGECQGNGVQSYRRVFQNAKASAESITKETECHAGNETEAGEDGRCC